jgi:hypothetical protein
MLFSKKWMSLGANIDALAVGDRVLTIEGTGIVIGTAKPLYVELDRGDSLPLTAVVARLS